MAAAITGDLLSLIAPGGGLIGKLADGWVQKRRKAATEILINEISRGQTSPNAISEFDVDPLIDIIHRYAKAVEDGAAYENLRLLAQIIAGMKNNKALDPDKFRKWAGILEQLTRDELMAIGKGIKIRRSILAAGTNAANDFWQQLHLALQNAGYPNGEISALCASVSRTGLFVPSSAFSGMAYMDTPWLLELGTLADLDAAGVPVF